MFLSPLDCLSFNFVSLLTGSKPSALPPFDCLLQQEWVLFSRDVPPPTTPAGPADASLCRKLSPCKQYVNYLRQGNHERAAKCKAPLFTPCCQCYSDNQHMHHLFSFLSSLLWLVPFLGLWSHWSFDAFYRNLCTLKKRLFPLTLSLFCLWAAVLVLLKQRLHEKSRRVFTRSESTRWLNIMWQVRDKIGLIKIRRKGNIVIMTWWCCINAIFNGDSCNYDNFGPLAFWLRC